MDSDPGNRTGSVVLYWIPLGAGARFVRFNGKVYEAISALIGHRPRRDIFHTALEIALAHQRFTVEMTPIPNAAGVERGVVAEGPVGFRVLGRFRIFRYEVRRWHDGVIPDLPFAVASPIRITDDAVAAQRIFDLLPAVPTAVWGRDELRAGEMWSCNSIISWTLAQAGIDVSAVPLPAHARAPGWDAGVAVARRGASHATPRRSSALAPQWGRSRGGPGRRLCDTARRTVTEGADISTGGIAPGCRWRGAR